MSFSNFFAEVFLLFTVIYFANVYKIIVDTKIGDIDDRTDI